MIRVHAFMVRLPSVSRDEFRDHYEQIHVPTAMPILGGTRTYVRHHVREELHGTPPFDCMTLFEYPDPATIAAVFARVAGPESAAVHADEDTFMHVASNFYFPVETGPAWQATPERSAREIALVCARRRSGEDRERFRERFVSETLPRLRNALSDPACLQVFWPQSPDARYDANVLVGASRVAGLAQAARELERDGGELVAARVSVHATEMGA
ncbi:MAG TPA: EthD domain-containing protein [Myxococcota bacterium]|nr:EthD domain-containing protein [Myxococcota bacterium]